MELLFYLMMEKGVCTWEKRVNFFSTAHTDEHIETVIHAVRDSILEMRSCGFPMDAS
ncbi:MAG: hypothetical protein GY749_31860 [Desulfobacteraceae bacterium]|nr:hypothetical protein [Desulfobacteraceae bacterium]